MQPWVRLDWHRQINGLHQMNSFASHYALFLAQAATLVVATIALVAAVVVL